MERETEREIDKLIKTVTKKYNIIIDEGDIRYNIQETTVEIICDNITDDSITALNKTEYVNNRIQISNGKTGSEEILYILDDTTFNDTFYINLVKELKQGINKIDTYGYKMNTSLTERQLLPCDELYDGNTNNTICFYNNTDPYYEFTNFYSHKIKINTQQYFTTEIYFQANKHEYNSDDYKTVAKMENNWGAFHYIKNAKKVMYWTDGEWFNNYQLIVMWTALVAKFLPNQSLRRLLLDTDNKLIVEHTENDWVWGDGGNGSGTNYLGRLLMKLRGHIKTWIKNGMPDGYGHFPYDPRWKFPKSVKPYEIICGKGWNHIRVEEVPDIPDIPHKIDAKNIQHKIDTKNITEILNEINILRSRRELISDLITTITH